MTAQGWRVRASMAVLALAMGAGAAQAQAVSGVEVLGTRPGGLNLTEQVTTGSRLGLTSLETPASIELLSGDAIRARGDLSLADAITRSTGIVQQNNPGNGSTASFAARGFSGVGSVMTLYDGMRLFVGAGTVSFPFDPWTVEQVEVLKGPASVLYGQGAIGGAVNVVPKRPSFTSRTYDFQAGIGSDRTYRLGVGVGGPANDKLAYRFDASRQGSNGYVDRGDSDSWALSGAVTWRPQENLRFTLSDDYGYQNAPRYFGVPLVNGEVDDRNKDLNYNVFDSIVRYKDNIAQLRAEWEPSESVKLRNTAYLLNTRRQWRNVESYFLDSATNIVERTDYIPIKHNERQYGDTVDVSFKSKFGEMENTLLVGGEANRIRFVHTNDGFPSTSSFVNVFSFEPGLFDEQGSFIPRYRTNTRQLGAFAEDQLKITPQISIVAGVRYDSYRVRRQDLVSNTEVVNKKLDNTSWRVGAIYQPTSSLSFYAQYATGADPLGSLITTSVSQAAFDLATGRQYEVGAKGVLFGGKAEWTLAAYKIVKEKLLARVPNQPNLVQQVGQQSSKGIEASLSVQLTNTVSLDANGTILDAKFDDFTDFAGGQGVSRNGNTPPNAPQQTGNVWLSWMVVPEVRLYGGVRYVGKQYGDNANSPDAILPSYTVADAGVQWSFRSNLSLDLHLFNAFDKVYATNAYNTEQWILGRPRAFEVRLSGRF